MRIFIQLALSNFPLTFLLIGLAAAMLSFFRRKTRNIPASALEETFAYFLLFPLGISFFYNFIMHVFFGDMAARFIGWQNSPFQAGVGFASLGFAVVAFRAFRGSHGLRTGAVIGPSLFLLGAAAGHVRQMIVAHNFAPGNAGVIFYMDIAIPILGFVLLGMERRRIRAGHEITSPAARR